MAENENKTLPVQFNITKTIVFISALFFTFGAFLILSTISDLIIFRYDLFDEFINYANKVDFLTIFLLLLLLIILFISNDSSNLSSILRKRISSTKQSIFFMLFRLESALIFSLILFLLIDLIGRDAVSITIIVLLLLSLLFQTPYSQIQNTITIPQGYKLTLLNYLDEHLSIGRALSTGSAAFLSVIYPSPENLISWLMIISISKFLPSSVLSLVIFLTSTIFLLRRIEILSNRGNYFRGFVNILISLLVIYIFVRSVYF